jgi:hypothetical protein
MMLRDKVDTDMCHSCHPGIERATANTGMEGTKAGELQNFSFQLVWTLIMRVNNAENRSSPLR